MFRDRSRALAALFLAVPILLCAVSVTHPAAAQQARSSDRKSDPIRGATSPDATGQVRKVTFAQAAEQGLIDAASAGVGLSSGYSIIIAIRSRVNENLEISFVPTVLKNNCEAEQSMIALRVAGEFDEEVSQDLLREVAAHAKIEEDRLAKNLGISRHWRKVDVIKLRPYEPKLYILMAFCLEFAKHNPSSQCTLERIGRWSDETDKLFACLQRNPKGWTPLIVQLATWATTDDVAADEVKQKLLFTDDDQESACSMLNACGLPGKRKKLCMPPPDTGGAAKPHAAALPPPAAVPPTCIDRPGLVPGMIRHADCVPVPATVAKAAVK